MHIKLILKKALRLTKSIFSIFAALPVFSTLASIIFVMLLSLSFSASAAKFTSNYHCSDGAKECVQKGGDRIIDGVNVHRDCWQYSYTKRCNYPSKDNCKNLDCYFVENVKCLLKDSLGNCVNQEKAYACDEEVEYDGLEQSVNFDPKDKNAANKLVCKGLPCLDGSCVDKKDIPNDEMMQVTSMLSSVGKMKEGSLNPGNLSAFQGNTMQCTKVYANYRNCCRMSGWGEVLGANCPSEAVLLQKLIAAKRCVFVGIEKVESIFGVTSMKKYKYCCYPNVLTRIIQEQGRRQLNKGFGTPSKPDCGGLSMEEIKGTDKKKGIDFSLIDYKDFHVEVAAKLKLPQKNDIDAQIKSSMQHVTESENNPTSGINTRAVEK